jgi:hypothetical protein
MSERSDISLRHRSESVVRISSTAAAKQGTLEAIIKACDSDAHYGAGKPTNNEFMMNLWKLGIPVAQVSPNIQFT